MDKDELLMAHRKSVIAEGISVKAIDQRILEMNYNAVILQETEGAVKKRGAEINLVTYLNRLETMMMKVVQRNDDRALLKELFLEDDMVRVVQPRQICEKIGTMTNGESARQKLLSACDLIEEIIDRDLGMRERRIAAQKRFEEQQEALAALVEAQKREEEERLIAEAKAKEEEALRKAKEAAEEEQRKIAEAAAAKAAEEEEQRKAEEAKVRQQVFEAAAKAAAKAAKAEEKRKAEEQAREAEEQRKVAEAAAAAAEAQRKEAEAAAAAAKAREEEEQQKAVEAAEEERKANERQKLLEAFPGFDTADNLAAVVVAGSAAMQLEKEGRTEEAIQKYQEVQESLLEAMAHTSSMFNEEGGGGASRLRKERAAVKSVTKGSLSEFTDEIVAQHQRSSRKGSAFSDVAAEDSPKASAAAAAEDSTALVEKGNPHRTADLVKMGAIRLAETIGMAADKTADFVVTNKLDEKAAEAVAVTGEVARGIGNAYKEDFEKLKEYYTGITKRVEYLEKDDGSGHIPVEEHIEAPELSVMQNDLYKNKVVLTAGALAAAGGTMLLGPFGMLLLGGAAAASAVGVDFRGRSRSPAPNSQLRRRDGGASEPPGRRRHSAELTRKTAKPQHRRASK